MKIIVTDTSALIRLYLPDDPISDQFEDHVESAWRGETVIMVPEIALAEVAQVLWKKQQSGYISQSEADEVLAAVLTLPLEVAGHKGLLLPALSLARRYGLTAYDSLFLALAKKKKAQLVTGDKEVKKVFKRLSQF